jgi:hypothetical protein
LVSSAADGDASIQRGGFFPPHRGAAFKQRPQHNLLCLFRARLLGGAWMVDMAKTKILVAKTYKLSWGCPRWTGIGEKAGDLPKRAFPSRPGGIRSGNQPRLWKKRLCSRAAAVPHGGCRVRSHSRCMGVCCASHVKSQKRRNAQCRRHTVPIALFYLVNSIEQNVHNRRFTSP